MMNVEELEMEIKKEKVELAALEKAYNSEEDESKYQKMEYKISRKEETIDKLTDRQQNLLDKETKDEEKEEPKDKNIEEGDLDICESCGGDLVLVGTDDKGVDIYECERCHELYVDE
jgi:RNA polymerase-binding transcription factor DksA